MLPMQSALTTQSALTISLPSGDSTNPEQKFEEEANQSTGLGEPDEEIDSEYESAHNKLMSMFNHKSLKFEKIFLKTNIQIDDLIEILNSDPETFVKLLRYHRKLENKTGIKNIYYLGMIIIKYTNPEIYNKILEWTFQYPKDILNLNRFNLEFKPIPYLDESSNQIKVILNSQYSSQTRGSRGVKFKSIKDKYKYVLFNQDKIAITHEIKLYGDKVIETIKQILSGKDCYLGFFKYLAGENGHFATESDLIWKYVEQVLTDDSEFIELIGVSIQSEKVNTESEQTGSEQTEPELTTKLKNILRTSKDSGRYFTLKNRRKIKTLITSYLNTTDNIMKSIHTDGSVFGSKQNESEEIDMIYDVIRKTPTKSLNILTNKIKKYKINLEKISPEAVALMSVRNKKLYKRNVLLVKAFKKYVEDLAANPTKKKFNSELYKKCYKFYESDNEFDEEIETEVNSLISSLIPQITVHFNNSFKIEDFKNKVQFVIDRSSSMKGNPIKTSLFFLLLIVKIFRINRINYLTGTTINLDLTDEEIDMPICSLIKKIYTKTGNATDLNSLYQNMKSNGIVNNTIVIFSDSDVYPGPVQMAPFDDSTLNEISPELCTNHFVPINLKENNFTLPYPDFDPKVCYVSCNSLNIFVPIIKSIIVSKKKSEPINPNLIVKYYLYNHSFDIPFELPSFNTSIDLRTKQIMFNTICKNLPTENIAHFHTERNHQAHDQQNDVDENGDQLEHESNHSESDNEEFDEFDEYDEYDDHDDYSEQSGDEDE